VIHVPTSSLRALRRAAAPHGRLPSWFDAGLALALFGGSLPRSAGAGAGSVVLDFLMVVPLLWRRRAPVIVFSLIWGIAAVQGLTEAPTLADSALLVAFYTVASASGRRTTVLIGIVLEIGVVLAATHSASGVDTWLKEFVALSGLATTAGVLGVNARNRRQILAGLRERAERSEHERGREVALATATERSRIAREMHDVIAHNLSVMVALCDGAGYHVHDAPDRVASALEQASRAGREALAEMRQLLGVLRDPPGKVAQATQPESGPELAPQPGIRQIEGLVGQVRRAGVPVTYTLSGEVNGAPPGMELALYRIVQEALTNTLKHAGRGASAGVSVICAGETIDVEVTDTGIASPVPHPGGAGLDGMRERAAVYGGSLEAGAYPGGGWRVHATLGLPAAVATVR
jgi:signal transduction histidine kinase